MNSIKGKVISNQMKKTVVVEVVHFVTHPKYKKLIKRSSKFQAHTEKELKIGEQVVIKPCKRISKNKYFEVV